MVKISIGSPCLAIKYIYGIILLLIQEADMLRDLLRCSLIVVMSGMSVMCAVSTRNISSNVPNDFPIGKIKAESYHSCENPNASIKADKNCGFHITAWSRIWRVGPANDEWFEYRYRLINNDDKPIIVQWEIADRILSLGQSRVHIKELAPGEWWQFFIDVKVHRQGPVSFSSTIKIFEKADRASIKVTRDKIRKERNITVQASDYTMLRSIASVTYIGPLPPIAAQ